MRVLLDTHIFLWFVADAPQLSVTARAILEAAETDALLSLASLWEIAIKLGSGKLELDDPFVFLATEQLQHNDSTLLEIRVAHLIPLTTLPPHYRDPFDRLLIAQAMVEGIPIMSADAALDAYTVTRL